MMLDVVANFSRKVEVDPTRFLDHEVCPEQHLILLVTGDRDRPDDGVEPGGEGIHQSYELNTEHSFED